MTPSPVGTEGDGPLARLDDLRFKFLDRLRRDRAAFEQARAADDMEQQRRIAHSLAGLAGTFGYPAVGEAAYALDQQLRARGPTPELAPLLAMFYAKLDEATTAGV